MPDYDIFVLDESDITLSSGQLDGVTQGDGSHLLGVTLTINAPNWFSVAITDNDPNFQDSDSSQVLNGPATIDGTTYASGARVEAEYGFTVSDGVNTWQLVGFNVNNSSPAYGTVEGLAFIGGPGGFPPVGVPLTVTSTQEGPNFAATEYATPICFVKGTQMHTDKGLVPIEHVKVGQLIQTRDSGMQKILWVGKTTFPARKDYAPIAFAPGAIGNEAALSVSPQHRVLVNDWRAEVLFGAREVLVPAAHLRNDTSILRQTGGMVTYYHLACSRHELILAEGAWSESFYPGRYAICSLSAAMHVQYIAATEGGAKEQHTARKVLRRFEAKLLSNLGEVP